jgi:hypothetical protein
MTMNSLMPPAYRRAFSARRKSSRGMVDAAWYSAARARKPGGGAGSSMWVTSNPLAASAFT